MTIDRIQGFFVDEDAIRMLIDSMESRARKAAPDKQAKVRVHINRKDNYSYTAAAVEDLFREPNFGRTAIQDISISIEVEEVFEAQVRLTKEFGILGDITGADHDQVTLAATELSDIIRDCKQNEIPHRINPYIVLIPLGFVAPILYSLFYNYYLFPMPDLSAETIKELTDALQSNSPVTKLDSIIKFHGQQLELQNNKVNITFSGLTALWAGAAILAMLTAFTLNYLFPRNVFYFGKQKNEFTKKKQLRSYLWWGVIISVPVSLLSTFIYNYFSKNL